MGRAINGLVGGGGSRFEQDLAIVPLSPGKLSGLSAAEGPEELQLLGKGLTGV